MRLKTETRNTQNDASEANDEKEKTHPNYHKNHLVSTKRVVLHLAIWTSVDGATGQDRKEYCPSSKCLDPRLSGRLVLGFVTGFVLGRRPPLDNTCYSRVLLATPYANTFISFKQQSFFIINRCSFFHFARFVMIFLIPENAL